MANNGAGARPPSTTAIDEDLLREIVQEVINSTHLETESDLTRAVDFQLNRITSRPADKKRRTIRAIAEAEIDPSLTRADVFRRDDCVSEHSFYSTRKSWYHDPLFREVLEIVIGLYRRWDLGRDVRETAERQKAWKEKMYQTADTDLVEVARSLVARVQEMATWPLMEIETDDGKGGKAIIVPAKWTMDTVPKMAAALTDVVTTADKLARLSLGMPTDKTAREISGPDGGPVTAVGMTLDEWRRDAERRRKQAAETMQLFEDEDAGE